MRVKELDTFYVEPDFHVNRLTQLAVPVRFLLIKRFCTTDAAVGPDKEKMCITLARFVQLKEWNSACKMDLRYYGEYLQQTDQQPKFSAICHLNKKLLKFYNNC